MTGLYSRCGQPLISRLYHVDFGHYNPVMNERLTILKEVAEELYSDLQAYGKDLGLSIGLSMAREVGFRYSHWLKNIEDYATKSTIRLPEQLFGMHVAQAAQLTPTKAEVHMLLELLAKQIDYLAEETLQNTMVISSDGLITNRANGNSHKFEPSDKRYKLIRLLTNKKGAVLTKTLMNNLDYGSLTLLSKEKRAINKTIYEKLGFEEFITRKGYRINPAYKVSFS